MRAFDGRPPVGIKIVFEGQEEYGSALDNYPPRRPELFSADAMGWDQLPAGESFAGESSLYSAGAGVAKIINSE